MTRKAPNERDGGDAVTSSDSFPAGDFQQENAHAQPPRLTFHHRLTVDESLGEDGGGSPPRLAFYGRTDAAGVNGAHLLARQFELCQKAAARQADITRFFYDLPEPLEEITVLAVHGAGGPPRRDGGWTDLVSALADPDRGFDLIVCSALDRIGHRLESLAVRCDLAAAHDVEIVTAEEVAATFTPLTAPSRRFVVELTVSLWDRERTLGEQRIPIPPVIRQDRLPS